jgi:hypothetical protein
METKFKHGGTRPGAGRKPGSLKRATCAACGDPRAAALAIAVSGSGAFQFVLAMLALGAPFEDIRRALQMSQSQFAALYQQQSQNGKDA